MSKEFWLGILLSSLFSFLLGIVGALLIPGIKSWHKGWGKTREAAKAERIKDHYAETLYYIRFPHKFT